MTEAKATIAATATTPGLTGTSSHPADPSGRLAPSPLHHERRQSGGEEEGLPQSIADVGDDLSE
jgi:hypothetical protein